MKDRIGFLGLGRMGTPIARNLLESGYRLAVYNRTRQRAEEFAEEQGVRFALRPAEAPGRGGIAISMVSDDRAVEEIVTSDEFLDELRGGVHVSMSTISPATARRLARLHEENGSAYVGAPVFGRPDAAAARKLWICLSGPESARERVRPILSVLGQGIFEFGEDPGAANVVKLCGNFLIAAAMESMGEAWTLAEKSGLSRTDVARFFGQTLFACPIYQNYGAAVAERRHGPEGFRLALGLKDINLVVGAAADAKAPMPVAALVRERLLSGVAKGREDLDWSALALGISEDAGIRVEAAVSAT
jgi:3-hydroxyisobutyrate dehydrogenase-like beta-hydroxyacid dehydrogenase